MSMKQFPVSIGIIGSADGPTSVLVSSPASIWAFVIGSVVAVAALITVFVFICKKK